MVPESLDDLQPGPFPAEALDSCKSALLLFCAGFYGRNDAIHLARAGVADVTGVDRDAERLAVMRALYPSTWSFVEADVFAWHPDRRFDLVIADPQTSDWERMYNTLPIVSGWAHKMVVLGTSTAIADQHERRLDRSSSSAWVVLPV
jgi:hypothetical protein